jgi:hypothetical protein
MKTMPQGLHSNTVTFLKCKTNLYLSGKILSLRKWRRSMFTKALATLSVATLIAVSGASVFATAADAHQRPASQTMQTQEVWVGNEFVGRDSDSHVRLELRRTYGNTGG